MGKQKELPPGLRHGKIHGSIKPNVLRQRQVANGKDAVALADLLNFLVRLVFGAIVNDEPFKLGIALFCQTGIQTLYGRITSYNVCYTKLLRQNHFL